jgi:hypothetical protein
MELQNANCLQRRCPQRPVNLSLNEDRVTQVYGVTDNPRWSNFLLIDFLTEGRVAAPPPKPRR